MKVLAVVTIVLCLVISAAALFGGEKNDSFMDKIITRFLPSGGSFFGAISALYSLLLQM